MLILGFLLPWGLFCGIACGELAARAGRPPFWWGFWGAVFGLPVLLIALCLRPRRLPAAPEHRERIEPYL
jgi:hypothetical protein